MSLSTGLGAEAKRPVTFTDLEGVASRVVVSTLDISADGGKVAIEAGNQLSVIDARTGRRLQDLAEGLLPVWCPDSSQLAFYSNRSGSLQLWVWDGHSSTVRQITRLAGGVDPDPTTRVKGDLVESLRFSWSRDCRQIAFASRVAERSEPRDPALPLVLDNSTPPKATLSRIFAQPGPADGVAQLKDGRTWGYRKAEEPGSLFSQIFLADVATGMTTQITDGRRSSFNPVWAPDKDVLALAEATNGVASLLDARDSEIIVFDPALRRHRAVTSGAGLRYRPRWSPDGKQLAYFDSSTLLTDPQIDVTDPEGEKSAPGLTLDRQIFDYDWATAKDFWVSYLDSGFRLARLAPGAYRASAIPADRTLPAVRWRHALDNALVWLTSFDTGQVWARGPESGAKPRELIDFDPGAGELEMGRIEAVTWRTARGDTLEGKVLYPPGFRNGTRYPAIVDVYPLGGGSTWMHPMEGNQAWGAAGYVVFKPQPRAPHVWQNCSRDADFCKASKGPQAWDVMADDVMSGVEFLIQRGVIDRDRMCLYGHSNGASTVDYLVTQTTIFKCAVSVSGAFPDWISPAFLHTDDEMKSIAGVEPWEDPEGYIKLSAVFRIEKVSTPMLLAVGDSDPGFLLGTIRMYNALRRANKHVTLLRYPGQGHVFVGKAMRDFWGREMAFFAKYLN